MFKRKLILNRPFSPVVLCFYLVAPTSSPGLKVQIPIPTSTLNATEAEIHIKSIDQAAVSTTVANVKKNCRLDELKDTCCCYCWAIEAHVHTVGIVVRNSELPYSYHLCPTMPYLLGFWYFLPRTVILGARTKKSRLSLRSRKTLLTPSRKPALMIFLLPCGMYSPGENKEVEM